MYGPTLTGALIALAALAWPSIETMSNVDISFQLQDVVGPLARDYALLLNSHDTNVVLNYDRGSLQVIGCEGNIIANIPLSPDEFLALVG